MGSDRTFHSASSREPDARAGPDPGSSPGPGPPCDLDGPESHLEVSAPPDRADVCCGTREPTVFLTLLGYRVEGADFTEGVLERARTEHVQVKEVRWLCLDIENDDLPLETAYRGDPAVETVWEALGDGGQLCIGGLGTGRLDRAATARAGNDRARSGFWRVLGRPGQRRPGQDPPQPGDTRRQLRPA